MIGVEPLEVKYLQEFKTHINYISKSSKRLRPQDKARVIFEWDRRKATTMLKDLKIDERRIRAIKMVADGISPLHVSGEFNCSSDTIKSWIKDTYDVLLSAIKWNN